MSAQEAECHRGISLSVVSLSPLLLLQFFFFVATPNTYALVAAVLSLFPFLFVAHHSSSLFKMRSKQPEEQ